MPYIQYSPWMDAANFGRGLGDTLGQILLQVPRIRAEQKMQQTLMPLQLQQMQLQGQMQQRQLANMPTPEQAQEERNVRMGESYARTKDIGIQEQQQNIGNILRQRQLDLEQQRLQMQQSQPYQLSPGQQLVFPGQLQQGGMPANYVEQAPSMAGGMPQQPIVNTNQAPMSLGQLATTFRLLSEGQQHEADRLGRNLSTTRSYISSPIAPGSLDITNRPNPAWYQMSNNMVGAQQGADSYNNILLSLLGRNPAVAALLTNQPSAPAPQSERPRLRVQGPNGQTGTIEQGDSLPPGWQILQ